MFSIRRVAETGSTNDDASALLGEPGCGGTVIVADFQRAGRGRRARSWLAPPGSALLFTAILPEPVPARALWAMTLWTALGVADGVQAATAHDGAPGVALTLQWPNDLLLDGRKCCGILCVSRVHGDAAWVACGVGLNVHRPARNADLAAIVPPPAFLDDIVPNPTRERALDAILDAFSKRLGELADPDAVARAWERRAALAGTPYRILRDGEAEPFDARALRIANDGGLVVERDGREETVSLADARVLRA